MDLLESRGYKVQRGSSRWNDPDVEMGAPLDLGMIAQVAAILRDGGWLQGAADGRADGKAVGY